MLPVTLPSLSLFLIRTPEQCPSVVSLLSESYNPHVRYGAAMALGICCAGTGNKVKPKSMGSVLSWRQTGFPYRKVYVTAIKMQVFCDLQDSTCPTKFPRISLLYYAELLKAV